MHVVSRYTAAEAAATIDPAAAIALSVVIAAGALLLIMPRLSG